VAGKKDVFDIVNEKFDRRWKREGLIVDAERFKTYDEVFDHQNLEIIYRLMTRGHIEALECPISTGKEANVYKAKTEGGPAAVKIFRTSTSTFRSFTDYIDGDRRFTRIDRSHRGIIYTWARKEYLNLEMMRNNGIRVPSPRIVMKNVLVMDYISHQGAPAPQLRILRATDDEWESMWKWVLKTVKTLVRKCELVHADLSEYNILYNGKTVLIDVGQAVHVTHPSAREFLERDMRIISSFFEKKGIEDASESSSELVAKLMPGKTD
jgi:RIO kinase 1